MSTEITMPKLSDTMTEGTLVSWKKGVGEWVERGDVIAEVETDKATMELETFSSGILLRTMVKVGELVPVGTVIAVIGTEDEKPGPRESGASVQTDRETETEERDDVSPVSRRSAEESHRPESDAVQQEKASPMVRRMARESGIDLALITGTGPDGRITREDLERFAAERGRERPIARTPTEPDRVVAGPAETGGATTGEPPAMPPTDRVEPFSGMRAAIARTVNESWRSIPHFTVTVDIDMKAAEDLHRGFKDAGVPVSLNDIVVKASAMALTGFPRLNASCTGAGITIHPEISIGIAVDVESGLLIPVIRGCEALSLREIGLRSSELIARARSGKISMGEISGGTFTVSNLGMFGVTGFTAIILPPQTGILAVGGITDRTVIRQDGIEAARMMQATLSADHRAVDGAYGARFLRELKRLLESPVQMMI